jgi:hypothetical protein
MFFYSLKKILLFFKTAPLQPSVYGGPGACKSAKKVTLVFLTLKRANLVSRETLNQVGRPKLKLGGYRGKVVF